MRNPAPAKRVAPVWMLPVLMLWATTASASEFRHPEELAAMLVSPREEMRQSGLAIVKTMNSAESLRRVLEQVARWGGRRDRWIAQLIERRAHASGAELKRAAEMIAHLQAAPNAVLAIDVCCAVVSKDLAERVLGTAPSERTPVVVWPDDHRLKRCLAWIDADPTAHVRFARRLPTSDRYPLSVAALRKITYVKDVRARDSGGVGPVIETLTVGAEVELTPMLSRDGKYVTISATLRFSDIVRPMKVRMKQVGNREARVQIPERSETTLRNSFTLPLGGHCVLGVPVGGGSDRVMLALLRATRGGSVLALPKEQIPPPETD